MPKNVRNNQEQALDQGTIANQAYNQAAGVHKVAEAGLKLKPFDLGTDPATHTTNASTIRKVGKGRTLALYNNSAAALAYTLTNDGALAAALTIGDTNAAGDVGVPVPANSWHFTNSYDREYVLTNSADLLLFIVEDDTNITQRS